MTLCMVCDAPYHYTKDSPCIKEVHQYVKECLNQPTILTNPFPAQQQHEISQNTTPPPAENLGHQP